MRTTEEYINTFPLAIDTLRRCKSAFYYDNESQWIMDQDGKCIVDVRGWGWIQKLDRASQR